MGTEVDKVITRFEHDSAQAVSQMQRYVGAEKSVTAAMEGSQRSAGAYAGAFGKLEQALQHYRREETQQTRSTRFFARELAELIPGSAGQAATALGILATSGSALGIGIEVGKLAIQALAKSFIEAKEKAETLVGAQAKYTSVAAADFPKIAAIAQASADTTHVSFKAAFEKIATAHNEFLKKTATAWADWDKQVATASLTPLQREIQTKLGFFDSEIAAKRAEIEKTDKERAKVRVAESAELLKSIEAQKAILAEAIEARAKFAAEGELRVGRERQLAAQKAEAEFQGTLANLQQAAANQSEGKATKARAIVGIDPNDNALKVFEEFEKQIAEDEKARAKIGEDAREMERKRELDARKAHQELKTAIDLEGWQRREKLAEEEAKQTAEASKKMLETIRSELSSFAAMGLRELIPAVVGTEKELLESNQRYTAQYRAKTQERRALQLVEAGVYKTIGQAQAAAAAEAGAAEQARLAAEKATQAQRFEMLAIEYSLKAIAYAADAFAGNVPAAAGAVAAGIAAAGFGAAAVAKYSEAASLQQGRGFTAQENDSLRDDNRSGARGEGRRDTRSALADKVDSERVAREDRDRWNGGVTFNMHFSGTAVLTKAELAAYLGEAFEYFQQMRAAA